MKKILLISSICFALFVFVGLSSNSNKSQIAKNTAEITARSSNHIVEGTADIVENHSFKEFEAEIFTEYGEENLQRIRYDNYEALTEARKNNDLVAAQRSEEDGQLWYGYFVKS